LSFLFVSNSFVRVRKGRKATACLLLTRQRISSAQRINHKTMATVTGDGGGGDCSRSAQNGTDKHAKARTPSPTWNKAVVFGCLYEVRKRIASTDEIQAAGISVPKNLARSFMTTIGEVELLNADRCVYKRVVNHLKTKFRNGQDALKIGELGTIEGDHVITSDVEDQLQFKPTEALADKVTLLLGYLCIGEIEEAKQELKYLMLMRESPQIVLWHPDLGEAFSFVLKTFQGFISWSAARKVEEEVPGVSELSAKTANILKVVSAHVLGNFRYKLGLRIDILNQVSQ